MRARYLLGIAVATAAAVSACGDAYPDALSTTGGKASTGKPAASASPTPTSDPSAPATNSPKGLAFYKANVHPFLAQTCGSCHGVAGPGPHWLTALDADKSYVQLFSQGYVMRQSRITLKPAHGASATNVLNTQQITTFEQWVEIELTDGGAKALPNVLEKLGSCFDRVLFDNMQMGSWRTQTRTADNNVYNVTAWTENANTCTGCKPSPCSVCHSADPGTNFNNAIGNTLLPPETTFENTKLTSPPYITKFFGVSPDGRPIPSDGIRKKSEATKRSNRDTHPLVDLDPLHLVMLDAFVNDAIAKYNAGVCGK